MLIMNVWKRLAKYSTAGLVIVGMLLLATGVQAAHEVSNITPTNAPVIGTRTQWTSDLTVQWAAPDFSNGDLLNGYVYKWNNSANPLLEDRVYDEQPVPQLLWDKIVDIETDPPYATKNKADLTNMDSDVLYLHIKTWYLDLTGTGNPTLSSDVVYGPFIIDNVAPTGTIRIVTASGNDITSTSNTQIYLRLAASKDPTQVYLSETSTRPSSPESFPSADKAWPLSDTIPGTKTLHAWFADNVGNISTTPATDSFTLLAPSSISPNTATIDLVSGSTQVFRVEGTTDSFTWTVSDSAVAGFSGGVNTGNSVTVQALKTGTFTLTATPATGPALTSGTITVTQSVKPGDCNGDGDITLDDVKLAFGYFLGGSSTTQQFTAANVYDDGDGNTSVSLHDVKGVFTLFLGGTL